jgi:hypothetical protein
VARVPTVKELTHRVGGDIRNLPSLQNHWDRFDRGRFWRPRSWLLMGSLPLRRWRVVEVGTKKVGKRPRRFHRGLISSHLHPKVRSRNVRTFGAAFSIDHWRTIRIDHLCSYGFSGV